MKETIPVPAEPPASRDPSSCGISSSTASSSSSRPPPMGIYGVVSNIAHGHVATTILIAMFAMLLTAVSYGRMARTYPRAGSAFTYVSESCIPVPAIPSLAPCSWTTS